MKGGKSRRSGKLQSTRGSLSCLSKNEEKIACLSLFLVFLFTSKRIFQSPLSLVLLHVLPHLPNFTPLSCHEESPLIPLVIPSPCMLCLLNPVSLFSWIHFRVSLFLPHLSRHHTFPACNSCINSVYLCVWFSERFSQTASDDDPCDARAVVFDVKREADKSRFQENDTRRTRREIEE